MSTIDITGASYDSYDDAKTDLETLFKAAFGENIDVTADSVFGHLINILALTLAEQNELCEDTADGMNPQAAAGAALSELVLINGIQRQESAYSTVSLSCTANAKGATIPAGSLVSDPDAAYQWATDSQLVLGASATDSVSATCTETGAVAAAANTLTQIDTPVYGWASANNPAAATEGQTEETDSALRARRQTAAQRASTCSTSAIYAAVTEVSGVTDCIVRENTSGSTDSDGVPTGNIWVIVLGGADNDIAEAIATHKAGGVGTHGTDSGTYANPTTGETETIYFDRPTDVDWYLTVNLSTDIDYPVDGDDDIEDAILAYATANQTLGVDVLHSRYYTPINSIAGHTVDSLYIDTTATPTATADISVGFSQRAVITAARIVINS